MRNAAGYKKSGSYFYCMPAKRQKDYGGSKMDYSNEYEVMDLFSILGVEKPTQKEESSTGNRKSGKGKSSKKLKEEYVFPYTIYSGCYEPLIVDTPENQQLSLEGLIKKWQEAHPEYTSNLLDFKAEKNKGYACFQEKRVLSKGTVSLNEKTRLLYGGHIYDLSSIMTDSKCEVEINTLQKLIAEETPEFGERASFYYDSEEGVLIPRVELFTEFQKIKTKDIMLKVIGRNQIKVSLEEYASLTKSKIETDEKGFFTPDVEQIKKLLNEHYPEFAGRSRIGFSKKTGTYVAAMVSPAPKAGKSENKFPANAKISLIFTKLDLSPDLFGGKEFLTESEIIQYLSKDYPEYTKERTRIEYDKKENLIIPVLKGSTKGALISVEEQNIHEKRAYRLEYIENASCQIRRETLPFAFFQVSMTAPYGELDFYLPKIPYGIYKKAETFFGYISKKYGTEAMLQIFWNKDKREYELYCPTQICSYLNVECERNYEMESRQWLIMELHSHGTINCSFSDIDDKDETGTRLYGVFYGYHAAGHPEFDLRAGCGGHHFPLKKDVIFSSKPHVSYGNFDFKEWENKLIPATIESL